MMAMVMMMMMSPQEREKEQPGLRKSMPVYSGTPQEARDILGAWVTFLVSLLRPMLGTSICHIQVSPQVLSLMKTHLG